jgi:hypothetical protein
MMLYIDRRLGSLLVLEGKLPSVPTTLSGEAAMSSGQLRYWSLCMYRSLADTAAGDCVFDERLSIDVSRHYTVVVSRKEDRPNNARKECGVSWLDWGDVGDGVGNNDGGFLMVRNMLPEHDFKASLFNVLTLGDEKRVLKEYYPSPRYLSKSQFESQGCPHS